MKRRSGELEVKMDLSKRIRTEKDCENFQSDKDEMDFLKEINEKFRVRKPKYTNKVLTGYKWNRYNKTHYDSDNPPPQTILGYQFNIDYRELMDDTQLPTYTIQPLESGYSMLKFSAGPPYQDIAFKILEGEWDCSYKHGYKCQFRKGVLELWFKFKRLTYRR